MLMNVLKGFQKVLPVCSQNNSDGEGLFSYNLSKYWEWSVFKNLCQIISAKFTCIT